MNNIEYYKSLISDEEVIRALIKESKAREGDPFKEKTRLRPNLNFFQRTVTNLVSSNKRIPTTKHVDVPKERKKITKKVKSPHTLMKEILLANKIKFVKSDDQSLNLKESLDIESIDEEKVEKVKLKSDLSKSAQKRSINFNLNIDKMKFSNSACTSISKDVSQCEKRNRKLSDSSEISIVSISSSDSDSPNDDVIVKLSDSDSDSSASTERHKDNIKKKGKGVCKHKCKTKLKKKRKK